MKTLTLILTLGVTGFAQAADKSDLIRLYEDEILAQDLYIELGKIYPDIRPLQNIPQSEARHRQVMAGILEKEGIALPKPPEGRKFVTKGLDEIYRDWLEEGRKSEADACRVGVRLEDHDIAELRAAAKNFAAHAEALAGLEAASNNHLRAFHRNLTSRGGSYMVEALPQKDFEAILTGEHQACDEGCGGNCGQGGKGKRKVNGGGKAGAGGGQGRGRGPG